MKHTPRNLPKHELIGLLIKVLESTHKGYTNISGVVIDETMKTLKILCDDGKVRIVPKEVCIFQITLPNGIVLKVNGKVLLGRPEDRIKKKLKYW